MTETLFHLSQGVNIGQHAEYFALELADGSLLECQEIVRRVPGKRMVCRGLWDGRMVFAKLFIGEGAKRYASRDAEGVQAMIAGGLLTPPLLYNGTTTDAASSDSTGDEVARVLLFQTIDGSINAQEAWQALPPHSPAQYSLALALVDAVAGHHQADLLQTDLYFKNFLVLKNRADENTTHKNTPDELTIYTLDGDGIRSAANGLSKKTALENLAQLFSKFDALDDAWIPALSSRYALQRKLQLGGQDIEQLGRDAMRMRKHSAHRYANKVFRSCTDVDVQQDSRHFVALARPYLDTAGLLLQSPGQLFSAPNVRLKSGNTCTVSLVTAGLAGQDDLKVVVKRYNIKSVWHGFNRMLRTSRAAISWSNAHLLTIYGIATAAPIALYEKRIGPLRRESYFLAEYVDSPDVATYFTNVHDEARREIVAGNIAQLFYKLRLLMIAHGDFKASNMKIVSDGTDAHSPVLIDLDSLKQHACKALFERRHVRDIRRFFRNWQNDAEISNLLKKAFQQVYLESGSAKSGTTKARANTRNAHLLQSAGLID